MYVEQITIEVPQEKAMVLLESLKDRGLAELLQEHDGRVYLQLFPKDLDFKTANAAAAQQRFIDFVAGKREPPDA